MRLATFLATVFPHPASLHLESLSLADQELTLHLSSRHRTARCPACQQRSRHVHSRFVRTLVDAPEAALSVRLELHVRRFRFLNPARSRQTFHESLPEVAPRYQRRTPPLQRCLETVSFALGGQAGRRLAIRLRLGPTGASRNTLLRLIRRAEAPRAADPRATGAPTSTSYAFRCSTTSPDCGTGYGHEPRSCRR